jgi:hypothetical protein
MAKAPGFKEMAAPAPAAKKAAQRANRLEVLRKTPAIDRFHQY